VNKTKPHISSFSLLSSSSPGKATATMAEVIIHTMQDRFKAHRGSKRRAIVEQGHEILEKIGGKFALHAEQQKLHEQFPLIASIS